MASPKNRGPGSSKYLNS
jgi:hypothetical protein